VPQKVQKIRRGKLGLKFINFARHVTQYHGQTELDSASSTFGHGPLNKATEYSIQEGSMAGCCVYGNKPFGFIKWRIS
jgi:hypothetical protein